jgi:hypothetical protein
MTNFKTLAIATTLALATLSTYAATPPPANYSATIDLTPAGGNDLAGDFTGYANTNTFTFYAEGNLVDFSSMLTARVLGKGYDISKATFDGVLFGVNKSTGQGTLNSADEYSYQSATLSSGTHTLVVFGKAVGGSTKGFDGSIYLTSMPIVLTPLSGPVAPVPEPETYAMLLAGLGLMGAIARRRNKAKST